MIHVRAIVEPNVLVISFRGDYPGGHEEQRRFAGACYDFVGYLYVDLARETSVRSIRPAAITAERDGVEPLFLVHVHFDALTTTERKRRIYEATRFCIEQWALGVEGYGPSVSYDEFPEVMPEQQEQQKERA